MLFLQSSLDVCLLSINLPLKKASQMKEWSLQLRIQYYWKYRKAWKIVSRFLPDLKQWPLRCWCNALPTELWSLAGSRPINYCEFMYMPVKGKKRTSEYKSKHPMQNSNSMLIVKACHTWFVDFFMQLIEKNGLGAQKTWMGWTTRP